MRLLFVCLALCACGQSTASPPKTAKIRLVPNVVAGTQSSTTMLAQAQLPPDQVAARTSALRIGSPTGSQLKSLKYFVTSIQLCQNVELAGSGYSRTEGCINLYQNGGAGAPDYATYAVTQAKDDSTPGRFIDLMTAEGQTALRRPVTLEVPAPPPSDGGNNSAGTDDGGADGGGPSQAGAYRFGLINFYRPIKVTAEFSIIGQPDQYFRTRAVSRITAGLTGDGRFNSERVQIGDTLSGPTEETTYMLNNGGALFTFQKPFVITQEDIDAGAEIKVDLVFNPENFGQAYELNDCAADVNSAICDPANNVSIAMPFVHLNPVPRKAGEKTRKETYLVDNNASSKVRIELYYNDADAEAGVQGVDSAVVYVATTNEPNNNLIATAFATQTGSVRTNDASISLLDYARTPSLTGLLRRQDGTATFHCLSTGALCPTTGMVLELPYVYLGDTVVSSD